MDRDLEMVSSTVSYVFDVDVRSGLVDLDTQTGVILQVQRTHIPQTPEKDYIPGFKFKR